MSNEAVINKINILPDFNDTTTLITLLIIPLAVQWWSAWYPGAEPGGGGYIAQRMLAAKDENHAIGATFFFNALHYALRPWPWILVALASIVVYPDIASIHEAFPNIVESKLGDDLAYSAMLTKLPSGLLGLVMASLIAAYMSTISTHLNWGSSYVVNDFYARYVKPKASQKELVNVGRISTVLLMVVSSGVALLLTNAYQLFNIILMFGAGTGLIFILRWFWWRINAWSEISAMFSSGIISILFNFTSLGVVLFGTAEADGVLPNWSTYPVVVLLTSIVWLAVTFLTRPEKDKTLFDFYKQTQPGGPGWEKIIIKARAQGAALVTTNQKWSVPAGILATLVGCVTIYGALFSTGYWIYGYYTQASILTLLTLIATIALVKLWQRIKTRVF